MIAESFTEQHPNQPAEIIEAFIPDNIADEHLRGRAKSTKHVKSRQYLARWDGVEAGYLSFENRLDIDTGVIYDLLVLPPYRKNGIGSQLVDFAETLTRSLGCHRIRLRACAFDFSVGQEWLENWYRKKGYREASDGSGELEKPSFPDGWSVTSQD
jgi:GNAT superfamily N-acetyltransferase